MEEYLTTEELCDRIKYQKQTIYNLIHRRVLVPGKHFLKPTPKKILFRWSAIQAWIGENPCPSDTISTTRAGSEFVHPITNNATVAPKNKPANLIRI
jgi:hypothetical protein